MRKSRFNEEQIIAILKESEAGVETGELCRRHGMTRASFYRWKSKYGGLELSEARRLKQLEEENRQLKHIVAEQTVDIRALKAVLWQKNGEPAGAAGSGVGFRTLNIVDDYTREAVAIEVDTSLSGQRVARVLEELKDQRGLPAQIRSDNGRSSRAAHWISGCTSRACAGTTSSRDGRWRTDTWSVSTGAFATSASTKTGSAAWPKRALSSRLGGKTTTNAGRIRRSAIARQRSLPTTRHTRTMEKTAVKPPWKTLRVSHFPTVPTTASMHRKVLCSKPKNRRVSHYPWSKVGGQVTVSNEFRQN